jgi:predicted transcriptional regulator
MVTPVLDQNRAYRKGIILGFTMAEISVLIIFCLLLATSFLIQKKKDIISKLTHENNELNQVKVKLDELKKNSTSQMEFDDLFQELTRSKAQAEKINKLQADLDKRLTEVKELAVIKNKLQTNTSNKSIKEIISELVSDAQYAKEIQDSLKNTSLKDHSAKEIAQIINSSGKFAEVVTEKMNALVEVERLKGQLANAQIKLKRLGKGTEMPPCWADSTTGKLEYIFKIDLTPNGFIIHNEQVQNRINDQKLLPINMIQFDRNLSQQNFLSQTLPLNQWSRQNNCRFFVKVKDETPADQKNTYKAMLRTLESHFYKLEQ